MNSTDIALLALVVSAFSLLVSGASFGWSVYKEVALRGRVKVYLSVGTILGSDGANEQRVWIRCTNHGPGSVKLESLRCTFVRIDGGKPTTGYAIMMHGWDHHGSSELPKKLEQGETATYLLPYTTDSFLGYDLNTVYVTDSFERKHMASRADVRSARKQFVADFVTK
jgi:hypothetical protein